MFYKGLIFLLMLIALLGLSACDSEPPTLMKATKQFESDEIRDKHIVDMRKNHMDALKHKRDETVYKGIRTEKNSINACINCHVPESYNGEILRHTDEKHFCTTCHTYVAAKLDCFECHVDHPIKTDDIAEVTNPKSLNNESLNSEIINSEIINKDLTQLSRSELLILANRYKKTSTEDSSEFHSKTAKTGGVSFQVKDNVNEGSKTIISNNITSPKTTSHKISSHQISSEQNKAGANSE